MEGAAELEDASRNGSSVKISPRVAFEGAEIEVGLGEDHHERFAEWSEACFEADALLRVSDFGGVLKIGERMCDLFRNRPRGWLLRHVAMKHLQAPQEVLAALLREGIAACEGNSTAHILTLALEANADMANTASIGDVAGLGHSMAPGNDAIFVGEWDAEGVYLYQAFCDEIADWALVHQQFGGPRFNTTRMTWVKPSFGWILYRSGYGHKPGQNRILKVKVSHESLGQILGQCKCVDTNKETRSGRSSDGASNGRVQWDPERDMLSADGREPRQMLRRRAIQIGLAGRLSQLYVQSVLCIQDVTELGHKIREAHRSKKKNAMAGLMEELPNERPYMPQCSEQILIRLGMMPGEVATALARLGRGKAL